MRVALFLAVSFLVVLANADDSWTKMNPLAPVCDYTGVAYGNGRWVLIGSYTNDRVVIINSDNGTHWTESTFSDVAWSVFPWSGTYSIAYDSSYGFIAAPISASNRMNRAPVWQSTDGKKWNFQSTASPMGTQLVANNGIYVSAGAGYVYSTKNGGASWASVPFDLPYANFLSVIGGQFMLALDTKVLQSTDGLVWTTAINFTNVQMPANIGPVSSVYHVVATADGAILALISGSSGSGAILKSGDNFQTFQVVQSWLADDAIMNYGMFSVADDKHIYVSVFTGNSFTSPQSLISRDNGVTWTEVSGFNLNSIIYAAGPALFGYGSRGKLSISLGLEPSGWFSLHRRLSGKIYNLFADAPTKQWILPTDEGLYGAGAGFSRLSRNPVRYVSKGSPFTPGYVGVNPDRNITYSEDTFNWKTLPGPPVPFYRQSNWNISGFACSQMYCVAGINEAHAYEQNAYVYYTKNPTTGWVGSYLPSGEATTISYVAAGNGVFVVIVNDILVSRIAVSAFNAEPSRFQFVPPNIDLTNLQGECFLKFAGPLDGSKRGFFLFSCQDSAFSPIFSTDGHVWKTLSIPNAPGPIVGFNYLENAGHFVFSFWGSFMNSTDLVTFSETYSTPTANTMYDLVADRKDGAFLAVSSWDNSIYIKTN